MNALAVKLLAGLSHGQKARESVEEDNRSSVSDLARIYEVARNALEYRAEHLMRRAAIERMLKRELVLSENPDQLVEVLGRELVWARYVTEDKWRETVKSGMDQVIGKYVVWLKNTNAPRDWVLGIASSEIEEKLNPNVDYQKFTNLAFVAVKDRIKIEECVDEDLVLLAAVEVVFSQMDQEGLAYHLFRLIREQGGKEIEALADGGLGVTRDYYKRLGQNKLTNAVTAAVRKQVGPLFLIRDMYFAAPQGFESEMKDKTEFEKQAKLVLKDQLKLAKTRVGRATGRSIMYVFLTKVILGVGVEIPIELLMSGQVNPIALGINLSLPVFMMWLLSAGIKLPGEREQKRLLDRAWEVLAKLGEKPPEEEIIHINPGKDWWQNSAFYILYGLLFVLFFAMAYLILSAVGFSPVSIVVFVFFMSVVTFFAYRIRQSALVYSYKPRLDQRASLGEVAMLPLAVVGGVVSQGVARLNFLAFVFDFLLEAPFKTILRFFDDWAHFLTVKRDEAMG